ncbi:MAG: imelysin family protein [Myxococcota bacterium]
MKRYRAWLRAAAVAYPLCALAVACSSEGSSTDAADDSDPIAAGFDRQLLLQSIADNAVLPTARDFEEEAEELNDATSAWAADPSQGALRSAAQEAWLEASLVWQRMEVMQFGPTGDAGVRVGGQSFRDRIYSWGPASPNANTCGVDQVLVANAFEEDGFFDSLPVTLYGLDALEYVLFVPTTTEENGCAPQATINQDGSWEALVQSGNLQERRARYAMAVSERLMTDAEGHLAAWEGFRTSLVGAGTSGPFASAQAALDDVFAGLFYVDLQVKDDKLGTPAGLSAKCLVDRCIDLAESDFADAGRAFVNANLEGAALVFFGGDRSSGSATGFDDYLTAAGATQLASELTSLLDAALAESAVLEPPLRVSLMQENSSPEFEALVDLHEAVRAFTAVLQSQFVSVLSLRIPNEGAGDND